VAESLGTAVLQVRLDDQGLVSGLNNAKRAATTALSETEAGANRAAGAFSNLAGRLSGILAGGFIAGGVGVLIGQLSSMASEADNANKATAAYGRALERFNQDVDAGNAQVTRLAERFGVLDTTVQQASTTLLRNGASLQDVERALTAAGASAAAQGTSIESAFQNVAIALATGRSELLESSGIITNLGPVYQAYAKSVNKSVEELTQAEKIQAGVNAIYKESRFEIEEVDKAMGGMAGSTAEMNREATLVRRELGEALTPVVIDMQRAFVGVLGTTKDLIGFFREYPGVLAGVTAAVGTLVGVLAVERAGGLGFVLGRIPGLATAAGRAIAVAFGPAGIAALAVAALAATVATLFADIQRIEQETADANAATQAMMQRTATGRAVNTLVDAKIKVGELEREVQEDIERLRTARKMNAPTQSLLAEVQAGTAKLDEARKALAVAQSAYDKVREANSKPKPTGKGPADEVEELGASVTKLIPRARELVAALNAAKGAEAIARAQAALDAFTNKNKDAQAAVAAVNKELADAARNVRSTATGAGDLARELGNIADAKFRQALTNAAPDRLKELLTIYEKVTPNAERYGLVLAEIERRQKTTTKTTVEAGDALKDYLDSRKFTAWAAALGNAKDKQLEQARAIALQRGELDKLRAIDEELDARREARILKMGELTHAYLRQAQAVGDKRYGDGILVTLDAVQRSYGAFTSTEDALTKLGRAGVTITVPMLDALASRFGEAGDASRDFAGDVQAAAEEARRAQATLAESFGNGLDATIAAVQRTEGAFSSYEDALRKLTTAGVTLTGPLLDLLAARFPTIAAQAEAAAAQVSDFGAAANSASPLIEPLINTISALAGVDPSNPSELAEALNQLEELSLTGPTEAIRDLATVAIENLLAARDAAIEFGLAMAALTGTPATSTLTSPDTDLVNEILGYQTMDPGGPDAAGALSRLDEIASDEGVSEGIRSLATLVRGSLQAAVSEAIEAGLIEATPATSSLTNPQDTIVGRMLGLGGTVGKSLDDLKGDLAELEALAVENPDKADLAGILAGNLKDAITQAEALRDAIYEVRDASGTSAPAVDADLAGLYAELGDLQRTNVRDASAYAQAIERLGIIAGLNIPAVSDMARVASEDLTTARDRALDFADAILNASQSENLTNPGTSVLKSLEPFFSEVGAEFAGTISGALSDPASYDATAIADALISVSDEALQELYAHFAALGTPLGDFFAALIDAEAGARAAARERAYSEEGTVLPGGDDLTGSFQRRHRGDRQALTGSRHGGGRNAPIDLDGLREGFQLGTVSLTEYQAGLQATITSLEAMKNPTLEVRNRIAELKAELNGLNSPWEGIERIGATLSGIGSAINNAFGESADGATKLFNAMGLIASTVPNLVQAFNILATATGSAFNTALGWIGLVLSAIQFVLNLIGVFRSKTKEEDAPKIDTNAGFAFGTPDTGKAPSIALSAGATSGFSYGAGQIQASNVMLEAAGIFRGGVVHFDAVVARLEARLNGSGVSTTGTNALAFGV
jgi:hypothetical protein